MGYRHLLRLAEVSALTDHGLLYVAVWPPRPDAAARLQASAETLHIEVGQGDPTLADYSEQTETWHLYGDTLEELADALADIDNLAVLAPLLRAHDSLVHAELLAGDPHAGLVGGDDWRFPYTLEPGHRIVGPDGESTLVLAADRLSAAEPFMVVEGDAFDGVELQTEHGLLRLPDMADHIAISHCPPGTDADPLGLAAPLLARAPDDRPLIGSTQLELQGHLTRLEIRLQDPNTSSSLWVSWEPIDEDSDGPSASTSISTGTRDQAASRNMRRAIERMVDDPADADLLSQACTDLLARGPDPRDLAVPLDHTRVAADELEPGDVMIGRAGGRLAVLDVVDDGLSIKPRVRTAAGWLEPPYEIQTERPPRPAGPHPVADAIGVEHGLKVTPGRIGRWTPISRPVMEARRRRGDEEGLKVLAAAIQAMELEGNIAPWHVEQAAIALRKLGQPGTEIRMLEAYVAAEGRHARPELRTRLERARAKARKD